MGDWKPVSAQLDMLANSGDDWASSELTAMEVQQLKDSDLEVSDDKTGFKHPQTGDTIDAVEALELLNTPPQEPDA